MSKQLVYSGRDAIAEASGTTVSVVDAAIRDGHLKTFLVGRKRKATEEAVRKWVEFLKAESDAGRPLNYRSDAALKARRGRRDQAESDAGRPLNYRSDAVRKARRGRHPAET